MIRVVLPYHLQTLARTGPEVQLDIDGPHTLGEVLDALETRYPMLQGTIRDHISQQRRPMLRYFACEEDYSHRAPETPLPEAIITGQKALLIIGAIAGG